MEEGKRGIQESKEKKLERKEKFFKNVRKNMIFSTYRSDDISKSLQIEWDMSENEHHAPSFLIAIN